MIAQDVLVALTVTNLHSIATSSTLIAGWTSVGIDTAAIAATDHLITGQIKVSGTAPTAGTTINLYAYSGLLQTPTWPDLFSAGTEGTEGTATVHDEERRDSGLVHVWSSKVNATTSAVYTIPSTSIAAAFGGVLPADYALFVTQDTGQALNASGSSLNYLPIDYV